MANIFPWQHATWQQLVNNPRPAHAYLLHGPEGSGKHLLATALAMYWLCKTPHQQTACGACSSCKLFTAGTHPDFMQLQPEEAGKSILISQVRELIEAVLQTSQQGGRKVVIVDPAEAMSVGSSNALLKSLEEPTNDTYFILISHQPSFLLPTIKSRCLLEYCALPSQQQSLVWLADKLPEQTPEVLNHLLFIAGGSPLSAIQLYEQDGLAIRAQVVEGVKQLLKNQQLPNDLAEAWSKIPPIMLFDWFSQWAHALLSYQLSQDKTVLGAEDMSVVLGYLAKKVAMAQVIEVQQWILEHRKKVLQRIPLRNDLLLESLLIRWQSLLPR